MARAGRSLAQTSTYRRRQQVDGPSSSTPDDKGRIGRRLSPPLAGLLPRLLERLRAKPCQTATGKTACDKKPAKAPQNPVTQFLPTREAKNTGLFRLELVTFHPCPRLALLPDAARRRLPPYAAPSALSSAPPASPCSTPSASSSAPPPASPCSAPPHRRPLPAPPRRSPAPSRRPRAPAPPHVGPSLLQWPGLDLRPAGLLLRPREREREIDGGSGCQ